MTARRILPVVAIAAAVAAVGLAFLAYRKLGKSSAVAPAEPDDRSAQWDQAWTAMRACVLGAPAASTDTGEAIAAADLVTPDRTCGRELVAVARAAGDGEDWGKVRRAIGELAEQLGRHQQRRKTTPVFGDPKAEPDRLADTLLAVEVAVAKVIDVDRPPQPAVLTALAATPIVVDGAIATQVRMWRNDMHVSAGPDGTQYLLEWLEGVPHVMHPANPWTDSTWSPALTWQAYVTTDGKKSKVMVAPADTGDPAADATTVATVPGQYVQVWGAIGDGANRILIYADYAKYFIARSTDYGQHWTRTKLAGNTNGYLAAAVVPAGNRLDVVWADTETRRISLDPEVNASGPLPAATSISPTTTWMQCATGAVWLVLMRADGQYDVQRADSPSIGGTFKTQPYLTSCSSERLVLQTDADGDFACDASACKALVDIPAKPFAVAIGADVLRYQTWDDVIALWWNDRAPVFARLPGGRVIQGVVDDHGAAIVVMSTDSRVEYAQLPK